MDRNTIELKGYMAAVPTPFTKNGEKIDYNIFKEILEMYLSFGVHGFLIAGSVGCWVLLTDEERLKLFEIATEVVNGRVPVIGGTSACRTSDVIKLTNEAKRIGVDVAMISSPPAIPLHSNDLIAHYKTISDGVGDIPILVYNLMAYYPTDIVPSIIRELVKIPQVIGIKNSTSNLWDLMKGWQDIHENYLYIAMRVCKIAVPIYREFGLDGYIGAGMLLGEKFPKFFEYIWAGELDKALEIATQEEEFQEAIKDPLGGFIFARKYGSGPAWLQAGMDILGQPAGSTRPPVQPLNSAEREELKKIMKKTGII